MENLKVDFKKLKSAISIERVLEHYGVRFRAHGAQLVADCPLPTHTSKESRQSFKVNSEKGIWTCKSDSCSEGYKGKLGGKRGGDSLDLVAVKEDCSILQAAKLMMEWFPETEKPGTRPGEVTPSHPTPSAPPVNKPLSFALKGICYHECLEKRGISKELAEKFGVGFFPGKGSMAGRVVIPIHNEKGELVAYAGRALNGEQPKYRFPDGFHRNLVLYNRENIKGDAVTVVEGFFDCMRVCEARFPCVALMGDSLSEEQETLLAGFRFITLFLDPDKAGMEASLKIAPRLALNHYVRIVVPPKDPKDMTPNEIRETLRWNGVCAI